MSELLPASAARQKSFALFHFLYFIACLTVPRFDGAVLLMRCPMLDQPLPGGRVGSNPPELNRLSDGLGLVLVTPSG